MPAQSNQEYSARTLGATWGIISAVMVPIVIVLICIGWRILKRRKAEENDENDFMTIKNRPIDPDESMKINSDDESIPYKKEIPEDSPEPTEPVQVVDNPATYPYGQYGQPQTSTPQNQQYEGQGLTGSDQPWTDPQPGSSQYDQSQLLPPPPPPLQSKFDAQRQPLNQSQARQWEGETEIN